MVSLNSATKLGRRIMHSAKGVKQAKMPMQPTVAQHVATYAGLGVATGVANNAINQGILQHKKNQEHTAYQRGKYAGKASAQHRTY